MRIHFTEKKNHKYSIKIPCPCILEKPDFFFFFKKRLYLIGKTHLFSSQKCSLDQSGKNRDADETL